jgi:hypothetical protein
LNLKNDLVAAGEAEYSTFQCSPGWFKSFRERNKIKRQSFLKGEAASVDPEKAASEMLRFRQLIEKQGIPPDRIYNADETGLLYNKLPNTIYLTEDVRTAKGTKSMASKDRITIMLACNSTGTHKIPLFVIGKSANPHCFRDDDCPQRMGSVVYTGQNNAWMDRNACSAWFSHFLNCIRARHGDLKVILYWDNAPAHFKELGKNTQVKIYFLPENLTSLHQPLDQGIIKSFKSHYKISLLKAYSDMVEDIEIFKKLRETCAHMRGGRKGLKQAEKPHILDAIYLARQSWDQVSQTTIVNCFLKSNSLPLSAQEIIQTITNHALTPDAQEEIRTRKEVNSLLNASFKSLVLKAKLAREKANEICTLLDNLHLINLDENESDPSNSTRLEDWVVIEEDDHFQEALVEEIEQASVFVAEDATEIAETTTAPVISNDLPIKLPPLRDAIPHLQAAYKVLVHHDQRFAEEIKRELEELTSSVSDSTKVQTSIRSFFTPTSSDKSHQKS